MFLGFSFISFSGPFGSGMDFMGEPYTKNKKNERVGSYSKSIPGPFPNMQPSGPVHPPLLNHTRPYAFNMRWVLYQVGPYKDKGLFPTILVWWLWKSRAGLLKNGSLQKK